MNILELDKVKLPNILKKKLAWAKSSLKQFAISRLILSKS